MFEPFLIVVFESLDCPRCKKMDLKIIQSLLERVQICKRCLKTKEPAGIYSEEQCPVELFRTNKGLMYNHHNPPPPQKKKTAVDHPGNHTVLRTKGSQTFEGGYFNNFSLFLSCVLVKIYMNLLL